MINDFDASWSSSFAQQETMMGEAVVIGSHSCTAIVVEWGFAEVVSPAGGRDRDMTAQIELSRDNWRAAQGQAGSAVLVRGVWLKVADDPPDSPDSGSVLLTLVPPHR